MFAEMNATHRHTHRSCHSARGLPPPAPEDGASFLLESVEHGRLGRHSFVGYGTRIVAFEEAEGLDQPSSATSATTTSRARANRPLPRPDRASREPVRRRRPLVQFDHVSEWPRSSRRPSPSGERLDGRLTRPRRAETGRRPDAPLPGGSIHAWRRAREAVHPRGRAFRSSSPSARAPTRLAVDIYRCWRVNPSPYLFLLELGDLARSARLRRRSSRSRTVARA